MNVKVPVGLASLVGYLLTTLGAAATAWAAASTSPVISAKDLAILTFAAGLATNAGRHLQGAVALKAAPPAEVLNERPESAVTPEAPAGV